MTCKDTPLRQRGHMEVLQWLLGEQGGAWIQDGWRGMQRKMEKNTKRKKNEQVRQ